MKIYIDTECRCHTTGGDGLREFDVGAFDGKCEEYIEGYIYVPPDEETVMGDTAIHGEAAYPWKPFETLQRAQRQYEMENEIIISGRILPRVEAIAFRRKIEQAAAWTDDADALEMVELFPMWQSGMSYIVGERVQHAGVLYKCVQAHTAQEDWTPDITPALWARVSVDE